ncbi:MAG: FAD-binding oxidoreductase [Solirubrobacterales bacterium]|nr:FAD-binding oxidoreductase [Solirubrobacterales bacterium]
MIDANRRTFLARAGGLAVAAAALPGWETVAAGSTGHAADAKLRALAREVKGKLIVSGGVGYRRAKLVYNARYNGSEPIAILYARNSADVKAAVLWGQKYGVRVIARSGGHSYAGYSTATGALVVDLTPMSAITVNRGARTVVIGAGARLIDIYYRLNNQGLTIPGGSCPTVGIGGLAQGGGIGLAARKWGTTSDNILSLSIITADGTYRVCTPTQHSDLFWACRGGGGGNFGVVTSFTFRVHPVTRAAFFNADWSWDQASEALSAWQSFGPSAPDELYSLISLSTGGSDGPQVGAYGEYLGSESQLRRVLAPLARAGASISTGSGSYYQMSLHFAGCGGGESLRKCRAFLPETFAAKSDYFAQPISSAGRSSLEHWINIRQNQSTGTGGVIFDAYGGAINRVKPEATAFVHRDQQFSAQYFAYWSGNESAPQSLAWMKDLYAAMAPHASGYAYQNYIDPNLTNWRHAYYGSNYDRLVEIKNPYDPDFFFRFRQAIGTPV